MTGGLGYRKPPDDEHIKAHPFKVNLASEAFIAEHTIAIPSWCRDYYDQNGFNACVGYSFSKLLSLVNEAEARAKGKTPYIHRYDAQWLWNRAKATDEWGDTNPGDDEGTSLRAACQIMKSEGHVKIMARYEPDKTLPPSLDEGILEYRWATTVTDVRAALQLGMPIVFGMDWRENFDEPELHNGEYWIARTYPMGGLRGGHAIMANRVSDERQAVALNNTWGRSYPKTVWMPYSHIAASLNDFSMECAIVTDRVIT